MSTDDDRWGAELLNMEVEITRHRIAARRDAEEIARLREELAAAQQRIAEQSERIAELYNSQKNMFLSLKGDVDLLARLRAELAAEKQYVEVLEKELHTDVRHELEKTERMALELMHQRDAHAEEIARLREALKPFADEMYDEAGDEMPWFRDMDDNSAAFTAWGVHCDLTAGDFRRACAALAPRPEEKGE